MTRRAITVAVAALLLTPALSDAHLMPEGQGSSKVVGNRAYSLISVPVGVLTGFDDDGNGASGPVHFVDADCNVVHAGHGTVVMYGVSKMLVVTLDGLTFVTTLDRASDLNPLLARLPGSMRINPSGPSR